MSSEEGGPPSWQEAPPSSGEAAPPGSEGTAPPGDEAPPPPGEEAPPPLDEEAPLSVTGAASTVETGSLSERDPALSGSDFLNVPASEHDEQGGYRVRPKSAVRLGQSLLSEVLSQSSRKSSRYHRSMSGIPNLQETLKERQVLLIIRFFKCHFYVTVIFLVVFSHN